MINVNEPLAANRRIPYYLTDSAGAPVTGVEFSAGEARVSKNGDVFANTSGTHTEIGGGLYYYEAPLGEVDTSGFFALLLEKSGVKTLCLVDVISSPTYYNTFRLPFFLTDSAGTALTGLEFSGAEIRISENGAALTNFQGTMTEVGSGLYYYTPHMDEFDATSAGFVVGVVEKTGVKTAVVSQDLDEGRQVIDTTEPVLAVISPTPGVAPGQPGGFSSDPTVAAATPIVIDVTDVSAGVKYLAVFVRFLSISGHIEVVYRRGQFEGLYTASSSEVISNGIRLTVSRSGGWIMDKTLVTSLEFDVDVLDASGNLQ